MRTYRLDTPRQTLVLAAPDDGIASVVYWGPALPPGEDLAALARAAEIDLTGGSLDATPPLSLCPETSRSFPGRPGLALRDMRGEVLHPAFRFVQAEERPTDLTLRYADNGLGATYIARLAADPETEVLTLSARLETRTPVILDWLAAPVLPGPQQATEMIDLAGRWTREFQMVRTPWTPGARLRENRTGRTGHEHLPLLYLPETGCTATDGAAYALHYGWSGGHGMVAEELPDGRRQVQFGHAPGTETAPGTRFETAPLYATYAPSGGLNGPATAFQRHLRDRIVPWPDPGRRRPVHYNCWEAVYFDHDLTTLSEIATRAAELGAERFVLDDGWFGRRDDDTTSLGDWTVDRRKWPEGLGPLIAHVRSLGMTFGLWVEPEMVNEDSDLFRAHPDWALGPEGQILGRGQRVLDLARPEVRDHLFEALSALLSEHPVDYLKWDHNRVLPTPDAAQARGTYALLDRLRTAHPEVEIESCASGGGRIDAGILSRTHRVWLSDSNDAHERLRMQSAAALLLPAAVTGSHVGPRHCHTSHRTLPMAFRAWVAAQRHMGLEMDPRELTGAEAATLSEVIGWWKSNRGWMQTADILRLAPADPAWVAELQRARDGTRFAVFAGTLDTSAQTAPRPLRLTGLDPAARYRVTLTTPAPRTNLSRGPVALRDGPVEATGQWLMARGLSLPWAPPHHMWVLEGQRLP